MRKLNFFAATIVLGLAGAAMVPTPGGAAGVGKTCDGRLGIRCDKGLWCDHRPGQCHAVSPSGKCIEIPIPLIDKPVCGCDRRTYENDKVRQAAKVHKDHEGKCKK